MEMASLAKLIEVGDLGFDGGAVGVGERFGGLVLGPFLGGFIEGFVILDPVPLRAVPPVPAF